MKVFEIISEKKSVTPPEDISSQIRANAQDPKKVEEIIKSWKKTQPGLADKAKGVFNNKFSFGIRSALNLLQLGTSLYVLAEDRIAIDALEKNGTLDANTAQNARDYAFRKCVVEIGAAIASSTISIAVARTIFFVIRSMGAAAGVASVAGALPTIAAFVASEVAVQAFVAWIKTEAGSRFFGQYLAGILVDDDALVQQAFAAIKSAIGLNKVIPQGSTQRPAGNTATQPAATPTPAQQAATQQASDTDAALKKLGLDNL